MLCKTLKAPELELDNIPPHMKTRLGWGCSNIAGWTSSSWYTNSSASALCTLPSNRSTCQATAFVSNADIPPGSVWRCKVYRRCKHLPCQKDHCGQAPWFEIRSTHCAGPPSLLYTISSPPESLPPAAVAIAVIVHAAVVTEHAAAANVKTQEAGLRPLRLANTYPQTFPTILSRSLAI